MSAADSTIQAAVRLHPRVALAQITAAVHRQASRHPADRELLDPGALEARYGPPKGALRAVEKAMAAHGIEVVEAYPAAGIAHLRGEREALTAALGGSHDGAMGRRPSPLSESVRRRIADLLVVERPLFHGRLHGPGRRDARAVATGPSIFASASTAPAIITDAYRFPPAVPGRSPRIGLILLGGGYHRSDLAQSMASQGLALPRIDLVSVGGATNDPSPRDELRHFVEYLERALRTPVTETPHPDPPIPPEDLGQLLWTMEATTDLQLLASFVNEARITAVLAPDTGWAQAVAFARLIADPDGPVVISVSWGADESAVPPAALRTLDHLFKLASLRGISICCSSGDKGSLCGPDLRPEAHFPASSPHVLACGGTKLEVAEGGASSEQVWNESRGGSMLATGGGFSHTFRRPIWQRKALGGLGVATRRALPDVAAKADYSTGYPITLGGVEAPIGGTSSAAPLWAALLARIGAHLDRPLGLIGPLLYGGGLQDGLRTITVGNNGHFVASDGWDACTGLGSPRGDRLLAALQG